MPKIIYKFRCENFELHADKVDEIFFSKESVDFITNFNHQLCTSFAEKFDGVFHVSDHHKPTRKGLVSIYVYCACKQYRLSYWNSDVKKKEALQFEVWTKTEKNCDCSKGPPKSRDLRGEARKQVKEQLKIMTNKQYRDQSVDAVQLAGVQAGNLQDIKSTGTIRKIRHEILSSGDYDKDDIYDLHLRARENKLKNIASLQTYPDFTTILLKDDWLKELIRMSESVCYTRLLLDATGNIVRKPYEPSSSILHHVLLAPIPKFDSTECFLFPVAEMITNDSTSYNIFRFLDYITMRLRKLVPGFKLANEIGTDFSFANINAIVKLNDNMTIRKLLDLCFDVFKSGEITEALNSLIIPQLCFSHISKNMMEDIKKTFAKPQQLIVAALIGGMVTIENVQELDFYIKNFITIIASPNCDSKFDAAKTKLAVHFNIVDGSSIESEQAEDIEDEVSWREDKAIYKNSHFYQHFKKFSSEILPKEKIEPHDVTNKFFQPGFVELFLKKYASYLPLWTSFIGKIRCVSVIRSNNARIERFFNGLKSDTREHKLEIGKVGFIKLGRYVEFQEKRTDLICKEIKIQAPSKSRNSRKKVEKQNKKSLTEVSKSSTPPCVLTESDLSTQTETWKKTFRKNNRKSAVFLNTSILHKELVGI